ncbi:LysM peptidoglycan-binding domain-containing protein [Nocardioides sp. W7]|uniref:LysM peptidoglycan-binding domain-containing protein n=1 Tax=Nocardioides sp. W7 TaxID=2931390 RepID=UPI001FCFFAF6|nr:LysM peptidoglycan-binding domain-containing protein [Nocardioides sp. W7]
MNATCARLLRCTLVWLASSIAAVLATAVLHADALALRGGPGPDLESALVRCCSAVLLGCAAWAWLATSTLVLQAARGRAGWAVPGVPASWRRLVLLACGTTLAAGLSVPASADPGLTGLPLPDRATGAATRPVPDPATRVSLAAPPAAPVTVRRGDSLWELAASQLGPSAAPAEVERHWRHLYALNRPVVGPDPDLIHPGQQLRLPAPPQESS